MGIRIFGYAVLPILRLFFFLFLLPKNYNFALYFSFQILCGLAFGCWFSSKIHRGFRNFFPVSLRSEQ